MRQNKRQELSLGVLYFVLFCLTCSSLVSQGSVIRLCISISHSFFGMVLLLFGSPSMIFDSLVSVSCLFSLSLVSFLLSLAYYLLYLLSTLLPLLRSADHPLFVAKEFRPLFATNKKLYAPGGQISSRVLQGY